ncbi:hypothetical protein BAUCODRAFT_480148 [Baudoinia panamericana UAMH 10762]|uniref:Uncharacterized protein n=1 Tax=Baudoinia panamericana (strain UAMH 10762) TaxID=717646 RepID=M2NBL7_BAUPA|nr:uncharacterized protein BAUCODRAFT_480148 [Baudoinia panamericana UAMH 10762]EMC96539.1 hypothetical protein BAUCODRAFT_480148 [Baudoinia panamericana UAMH 10762]
MSHGYSSYFINQLSQDRYGTDVPTLWNEIERLNRRLRHKSDALLRKEREYNDLKRRHEKLKSSYRIIFDAYDRVVDTLKEERRRWRRLAY